MKNKLIKLYNFSSSWTGSVIIVLVIICFLAQAFVIPSGSMKNSLLIGDHLFVKKFSYGVPTPHLPWLEIPLLPDFNKNGHLIEGDRPKRGDIVVFRYPKDPKIYYVKRHFALGGDEVVFAPMTMYLRPHEGDDFILKNYQKEDIVTLNGAMYVKEPYKFKGIHYDNSTLKDNFKGLDIDTFDIAIRYSQAGQFAMQPIMVDELTKYKGLDFNAFYFKVPNDEYFMVGDNRENSNDSRFWGSVAYKYIVGKPWFIYFSWNKNFEVRWERIGRFVDTLENDPKYIYEQP